MDKETGAAISFGSIVLLVLGVITAFVMWGCPQYRVYSQRQEGMAELARAESNRKIKIAEAQAKFESAKMLAQAEVETAKGVAQANTIIGNSLKNNPEYLRYLWIQGLQDKDNNTIYVPTEAGLPILEAGKRN